MAVLLCICLSGSLFYFAWRQVNTDYERTIEETHRATTNLAIAFEEHVRRVVAEADRDLLSLKRVYESEGAVRPVLESLIEIAASDPVRRQVSIVDRQGVFLASSDKQAFQLNVSEREYFRVHREADTGSLFISKPITGMISGQDVISLTRRLNRSDGSFDGIAMVALRADYFNSFYDKITLGPGQLIALTGMDGINRIRQAGIRNESGQDIRGSKFWQKVESGDKAGTFSLVNKIDNVERIASYRVMPDYPLVVAAAVSAQSALEGFEQRKRDVLQRTMLVFLFILGFFGLLVERNTKQESVHARLRAMADEQAEQVEERTKELQAANMSLAEEIKERRQMEAELEKHRESLQNLVAERTQELQKLNALLKAEIIEKQAAQENLDKKRLQEEQIRNQHIRRVIDAQEEERKRIARELHDETIQSIAAMIVSIRTAEKMLKSDESGVDKELEEIRESANITITELYKIIDDLRPSLLDDLGLVSAIRWYAQTKLTARGIDNNIAVAGPQARLKPEIETAVFRTVQEAVTNVIKYARASFVSISLKFTDERLFVSIADDGVGFNAVDVFTNPERRELGILGMRERCELLDGTFNLNTQPGMGTKIEVEIPLRGDVSDADQDSAG